jgi:hypothetical protein
VACCSLLSIEVVILILDAEKTIGGEGMISLLRIILFETRNYRPCSKEPTKISKETTEGGATTSLKNSCCISELLWTFGRLRP